MAEKATTSSAVSLSLPSGPAAKTAPDREGHLAQLRPPQLTSPTLAAPPSSNLAAIPHLVAPHGRESLPPRAGGHWDQPPLPRRPGDHPLGPCPLPLSRRLVHNPGPPPTLLGLIPSLPLATAPSEVSSRKAGLALQPLKPLPSRRFGHPSPHPACQVLGAGCAPGIGGRLARTRRASRDKRRRCKVTGRAVPARCPLGVEQPAPHTGSGWEETPRRPGRGDSPQSDLQTQRHPPPPGGPTAACYGSPDRRDPGFSCAIENSWDKCGTQVEAARGQQDCAGAIGFWFCERAPCSSGARG